MSAYPALNNAQLQPDTANEPYFVEVDENPCPHCHKGRTWTIIGPDGAAIGQSWGSDEDDECPSDAHEYCNALNTAFAIGQANPAVSRAMVDRFLSWKLPKDFAPDCHISFKLPDPVLNPNPTWPVGTNLFTADQAQAMLEHVCSVPSEGGG